MDKFKEVYLKPEKPKAEDLETDQLYHELAKVLHPDKALGYEELMTKLNQIKKDIDNGGSDHELVAMYKKFVRTDIGEPKPGDNVNLMV